ncbi:MAG: hypothetical protein OXC26_09755 [Albidovulum sp.]|nr:hypothetical protein [Albidovulum sp.]
MSGVKIVLLCEDKQTNSFLRKFLKLRKFGSRSIHTIFNPSNGSGEQYVRKNFPNQLKAIRQSQNALLIVVTDADNLSVEERRSTLQDECENQNIPPVNDSDRVVQFFPRRNIETWLKCLSSNAGIDVDEVTTYRKLKYESDCGPLATNLYAMCHEKQKLREPVPPSLLNACEEYKKFKWRT